MRQNATATATVANPLPPRNLQSPPSLLPPVTSRKVTMFWTFVLLHYRLSFSQPSHHVCSHGAGEGYVQQLVGTGRLFASVGTVRGGRCPPQVSQGVATSLCRHVARRSMAAVPSPRGKGVGDRHLTLPGQGEKKYTTQ